MISPEEEQELNAYHAEQAKITMTEAQQRAYDQAQVMFAFSQGKRVENKHYATKEWNECLEPNWDWEVYTYRIAPEPQEVWLWASGTRVTDSDYQRRHGASDAQMESAGYTKKLFREVLDA